MVFTGSNVNPNNIRSSGFGFEDLIFNQIRMIKELEREATLKQPQFRQGQVLALYHAVRGLETIIWGKLESNKGYLEEKEKIELNFEILTKETLSNQLTFMESLDKWQKLLVLYLRSFDFYPATPVDFISGKGIRER